MGKPLLYILIPALLAGGFVVLLTSGGCGAPDPATRGHRELIGRVFSGPVQGRTVPVHGQTGDATTVVSRIERPTGEVLGYAVELQVTSRSGPFPILVILDVRRCVRAVRVLRYTAPRGRGVLSHSLASQFEGKCPQDPIRVGADIDAVTGATLSSRALADGVRQAMHIVAGLP